MRCEFLLAVGGTWAVCAVGRRAHGSGISKSVRLLSSASGFSLIHEQRSRSQYEHYRELLLLLPELVNWRGDLGRCEDYGRNSLPPFCESQKTVGP
jgi:hypothetical protein